MSIQGLDVSEFQGVVDWEQVKASGCRFAMLRAGYGFGTLDAQFRRNAAECNRIGLPIGVYWFCYAISPETAVREANGCIEAISSYRLEYPVCYDIEQATVTYAAENGVFLTPSLATQFIRSFCSRVEALGYYAMFYSNRNFLDTYFPADLSDRYALWYAYYNNRFDGTNCGIWQYTDQGNIPGIAGNVDLDECYVDYPAVIRRAGLNHLDGSTPAPVPDPMPDPKPDPASPISNYVTYVIQPGDTLSEIAERFGTTYQAIATLNGIANPNIIYAGQTIKIPEDTSAGAARYYTIRPGDTLSEIAHRFGTTVNALAALNKIRNPNVIYAGTTIRLS